MNFLDIFAHESAKNDSLTVVYGYLGSNFASGENRLVDSIWRGFKFKRWPEPRNRNEKRDGLHNVNASPSNGRINRASIVDKSIKFNNSWSKN